MAQDKTTVKFTEKVLLETEHFTLRREQLTWDHPMQGQDGYVIVNKLTGVREAEGVDYAIAILSTHAYTAALIRRLEDPDGSLGNVPGFDPSGNPGPTGNIH
jgi:hypothetical protein